MSKRGRVLALSSVLTVSNPTVWTPERMNEAAQHEAAWRATGTLPVAPVPWRETAAYTANLAALQRQRDRAAD